MWALGTAKDGLALASLEFWLLVPVEFDALQDFWLIARGVKKPKKDPAEQLMIRDWNLQNYNAGIRAKKRAEAKQRELAEARKAVPRGRRQ